MKPVANNFGSTSYNQIQENILFTQICKKASQIP